MYASVDGGDNWFKMKNNIPEYAMVRDITIQPETNDLLIATHGRGIIVVDDITPMRELSQSIAAKDVYIFPNRPMPVTMGKWGSGGFPNSGGWYAGNGPSIQPIQYYLKDRMNSGEIKIEVYDADGKLVQSSPGSKRKGLNKVYWNLRYTPPKVAKGGSKPDYSGFSAPLVPPGDYKVKIKMGDKEYDSDLKLDHNNDNKDFPFEDEQLLHKTVMQLYNLHEDLYALVEKINGEQKMIKDNNDSVKTNKSKKLLSDYNGKLEALRATLLPTKSKSMFADEQRLREHISEVYTSLCYQEARPTNLQIERVTQLKEELEKAKHSYESIVSQYGGKTKEAIATEKKIGQTGTNRSSN
jgi:hypothetical protein